MKAFKERLNIAKADCKRHKIPGNIITGFLKRWSVPGCRYMILFRLLPGGIF